MSNLMKKVHNPGAVLVLLLMGLLLVIVGCSGDDGEDGAVGPMGPQGEPGDDGQDGQPGPTGPIYWQSEYAASTTYVEGDAVSYQGSAYICTVSTQGHLPTNSAYWDLLAQAGEADVWDGGDVLGQAIFRAGADFIAGTSVDFTGANVSGLPTWSGGEVTGSAIFQEAVVCQDTLYAANRVVFEDLSQQIRWLDGPGGITRARLNGDLLRFEASDGANVVDINGGESGSIDLWGSQTNSEVHMVATNGGDARIQLDSDSVYDAVYIAAKEDEGGCGIIELKNAAGSVTIEFDGCTGRLTARDSSGRATIELDPESGNIYYTGEMVKK